MKHLAGFLLTTLLLGGAATGCKKDKGDDPPPAVAVAQPAPTLTSMAPRSGPPGTRVTFEGTHLATTTAISFNGVAAPTFTVANANSVTVTVPTGATTGLVTLTTAGGSVDSDRAFTVTAPPDRRVLIGDKDWRLTSAYVVPALMVGGTPVNDLYTSYAPCKRDDRYRFGSTGTYSVGEGATRCDPNAPAYLIGTWAFNSAQTTVTVTLPGVAPATYDILNLSTTALQCRSTFVENGQSHTITYNYVNP